MKQFQESRFAAHHEQVCFGIINTADLRNIRIVDVEILKLESID